MKKLTLFLLGFVSIFNLTIEEKVGQIIMCPITCEQLSTKEIKFLNNTKIGGIILYSWANNLTNKKQLKNFTNNIQIIAKNNNLPKMFIAIDQEGGRIDRLSLNMPSAKELGESGEPKTAGYYGWKTAQFLNHLGINLNFAPCVDISSNSDCVINDRSFGDNAYQVARFAKAFAYGHSLSNVLFCLKHFPGHGNIKIDSHEMLPVCDKNLDDLMNNDLIPFKRLIDKTPFIMSAHIKFPKIDNNNPASFSKIFLNDILREKLNYKGIIISDSLRMDAIEQKQIHIIAIDAFNAGNDILLFGGNKLIENDFTSNISEIELVHRTLVDAVKSGKISMMRLDESVNKILKLKKNLN